MHRGKRGRLAGSAVLAVAIIALCVGTTPPPCAVPQEHKPPAPNFLVFEKGEELTYEVSYLAIRLGTITTRCTAVDTVNGSARYKTECLIRSYRGIPFVNLLTIFQSTVDGRFASVSFSTKERVQDTLNKYIHYTFPAGRDVVYISERIGNDPIWDHYDTIPLEGKCWQDGLSLLFFARAHAHHRYTARVPVLIYHSKAFTTIRFGVKEEPMEIDAVDYPIATRKLDGETGFTGIFGLTGDFEGWFTRDRASIPVFAKMHVIIGSIRIQLISWKKPHWKPPRHVT
ncbi:MAG: DUF3108 domain-containing protein [Bacteroidota bacterium]|nr:DUF3108 domain-containing protein [Bacteroidota bacterium]